MANKSLDNFVKTQTALYQAIMEKAIDNQTLTDNEFAFIIRYEKNIKGMCKTSTFDKLLADVKKVVELFNGTVSNNIGVNENEYEQGDSENE